MQTTENIIYSEIHPHVMLDTEKGVLWKCRNRKKGNIIYKIDHAGFIRVLNRDKTKQIRLRAIKVAWEIFNNKELPANHTLFTRNLDAEDLRADNIVCVPTEEFNQIRNAISNLRGDLKIKPHPKFPLLFVVEYRKGKYLAKRVVEDYVSADRLLRRLRFFFTKQLNKYNLTE